jgi:hypothetical protein
LTACGRTHALSSPIISGTFRPPFSLSLPGLLFIGVLVAEMGEREIHGLICMDGWFTREFASGWW